jgi:hypothetical protein
MRGVSSQRLLVIGIAVVVCALVGLYWHRGEVPDGGICTTSARDNSNSPTHDECNRKNSPPITPRTLKDSQKEAILVALAKAPPAIALFLVLESNESRDYLQQLQNILTDDAHWTSLHLPIKDRTDPHKLTIGWQIEKTESYLALAKGLSDAEVDFQEKQYEGTDAAVVIDAGVIPMDDYQKANDRPDN